MNNRDIKNEPKYGLDFEKTWDDEIELSAQDFLDRFYFGSDEQDDVHEYLKETFSGLADLNYKITNLKIILSNRDIDTFDDYSKYEDFAKEKPLEFESGKCISIFYMAMPVRLRLLEEVIEVSEYDIDNFIADHYEGQGEVAATEEFFTPLEIIERFGYSQHLIDLVTQQGQLETAREILKRRGVEI